MDAPDLLRLADDGDPLAADPHPEPTMIGGKVRTKELKNGARWHTVFVWVRGETTGSGRAPVPMSPVDLFAAHLPDPKPGAVRRLVSARTNRAGTVLVAHVRDSR